MHSFFQKQGILTAPINTMHLGIVVSWHKFIIYFKGNWVQVKSDAYGQFRPERPVTCNTNINSWMTWKFQLHGLHCWHTNLPWEIYFNHLNKFPGINKNVFCTQYSIISVHHVSYISFRVITTIHNFSFIYLSSEALFVIHIICFFLV